MEKIDQSIIKIMKQRISYKERKKRERSKRDRKEKERIETERVATKMLKLILFCSRFSVSKDEKSK